MKTPDLETLLRAAPRPVPPPDLAQRLHRQVRLDEPIASAAVGTRIREASNSGGRWWLPWVLAISFSAGAGTLIWQEFQLAALRNAALPSAAATTETASPAMAVGASTVPEAAPTPSVPADSGAEGELVRLRGELQALVDAEAEVQRLKQENRSLQNESLAETGVTPEQIDSLDLARRRSDNIRCINNLKQIGLATRIFAVDNADRFPSDYAEMQRELSTPKLLVCPADDGRTAAMDWDSLSPANVSYEYLGATASDREPQRVLTRCLIHGNVGLCDGSVQSFGTNAAARLELRDGKLYVK